jgi:tetratricopeptide (TPR) repeat protein
MFCNHCGAKIKKNGRFCSKCGAPVEPESNQDFIDLEPVQYNRRTARRAPGKRSILLFTAGMFLLGAAIGTLLWAITGPRAAARQFARGEKCLADKSYEKAVDSFTHAVNAGYNGAPVYLGLADAYIGMDDTQGAIDILHQSLTAVPEPDAIVDRLLSIGRDFLAEGDYAGIVATLEGVTDAVPDRAEAYLLLADGYTGAGDAGKAAETLSEGYANTGSEDITAEIDARAKPRGNTPGNISNAGFVAVRDGWVYYCNFLGDLRIYRSRFDGTERKRLVINGFFINVVDDWIYFCNYEDMHICKAHTDGTGPAEVAGDIATYINVAGDWIYYSGMDNELYKVRTDGTERTQISDDNCAYINVAGNWIYYSNEADGGKLYKVRTDGTVRTKYTNSGCSYINVAGDWIYFCNGDESGELCKIRTNGTQKTVILNDACSCLNVAGGWIYFSNETDGGTLYKMRTDGSEHTKLVEDTCYSISIAGDWIYYTSRDDDFYRVRTDGTGRQRVRY